jgi:succinoglycan biosynthesis transport protein ExoP
MNGNDTGGVQVSSREILSIIFRRRVPVIICALVVTAAALSAASRAKSIYDATAKVLIRRTGATALATTWTPFYDLDEEMNTEVEIITSDPVLQRGMEILNEKGVMVTETVKKHRLPRPPTVGDLSEGISAEPLEKSNIIMIKFRGSDRDFAREAANAIAQAYVEFRVQVRRPSGVEEYFEDQLVKLSAKLIDLSKEELWLRSEGGVYDREWQQRVDINREYEMRLKLNDTRALRTTEEGELAAIKQRIKEDPGVIWPVRVEKDDNLALLMLTEYWKVHSERDEKAATLTPSNPEVIMMNDRVAKMEDRLREETQRRIRNKEYLVEDLKASERAYEGEIAAIREQMLPDPDLVARIEHLDKEIHFTYLHYDRLLEKMLDTMASEADDIRISNAKILSPAAVKLTKAGQMRTVYVIFSILLGVTLGIGFGFLLENLDHSVKSATDVENVVGVQLLGSIPELDRSSQAGSRIRDHLDQDSQ